MKHLSIYNPVHANGLTDEQIIAMQTLTPEQIKELAHLFPNRAIHTAYLVLKDKNKAEGEQLNPLSTWENLHNLHKAGLKNFVAVGFKDRFQSAPGAKAEVAPLLDLTDDDIREAQGLKRSEEDNFVFPDDLDKIGPDVHPGFKEIESEEIKVPAEFLQGEERAEEKIEIPTQARRRGRKPNNIQ